MNKVCANFKITTPMFLGGADNKRTAELKPTSIKGALRFWFRAINYGRYKSYKEVKKVEDELFGSTISQGKVILKLDSQQIEPEINEINRKKLFKFGISYLGYGLDYERKTIKGEKGKTKKVYRPYLKPGRIFTLQILINPKYKNKVDYKDIIEPIKALGLFGGLGSRNRRGFGSVTLTSLSIDGEKCWDPPKTREEIKSNIKNFFSELDISKKIPEYTAFSDKTRTIILDEYSNYRRALNDVGTAMMNFRKDCKNDTDLIKDFLARGDIARSPQRVAFGLPHNYYIKDQGEAMINAIVNNEATRRASLLFIKIISIKNEANAERYVPILTAFPSNFLPKNSKISLEDRGRKNGRRRKKEFDPQEISYDIIRKFKKRLKKDFPDALEVFPID